MASSEEEAWYFEDSGVPVGWKEGAVALREEPLVWPLRPFCSDTAMGDILNKSYGALDCTPGYVRKLRESRSDCFISI